MLHGRAARDLSLICPARRGWQRSVIALTDEEGRPSSDCVAEIDRTPAERQLRGSTAVYTQTDTFSGSVWRPRWSCVQACDDRHPHRHHQHRHHHHHHHRHSQHHDHHHHQHQLHQHQPLIVTTRHSRLRQEGRHFDCEYNCTWDDS